MQRSLIRIGLVIPWFGKQLKGGAEQLAWQIANRLTDRGIDLTVLTTCCKEFLADWSLNHYDPGDYLDDGIKVKRFEVKPRNAEKFDQVNQLLLSTDDSNRNAGCSPINSMQEETFLDENIFSPSLQKYLIDERDDFDLFIFLPYLFTNVIKGCAAVQDKAILQPCLHDESYAYLNSIAQIHLDAKRLYFNSVGEFELAKRIYGPSIITRSRIIGSGIEAEEFEQVEYQRFVLSLGRRDAGKGTDILIESFDQFVVESGSDLKLLIAGVGDLPVHPNSANIVDLGVISAEKKLELLRTCAALVNPSKNESFSRVMFEAWYASKPVLINQDCLATFTALEDSHNAGFAANDMESFVKAFHLIDCASEQQLKGLGAKGHDYASKVTNWDNITDCYIKDFEELLSSTHTRPIRDMTVHQLMPGFDTGDAVSNQAIAITKQLDELGCKHEIHAQFLDRKMNHLATKYRRGCLKDGDILLYHHSIGFDYTDVALQFKGKKALIYHNITPKDYFVPYDGNFSTLLEDGRNGLGELSSSFPISYADSQFNADELLQRGFIGTEVLPLVIDPDRWNFMPDASVARKLNDGKKNILFTGRIAPNKKQTDLVRILPHLLKINPDVRICIVGQNFGIGAAYVQELYSLIDDLGVNENVWIAGKLNDRELKAAFMCADLYFSPSEHEGFGVPLIEAMWFDVPVLAYKSTAIPETLDSAAFMITDKKNLPYIAILINRLLEDSNLRSEIIEAQRVVREKYTLTNLKPIYERLIQGLLDA